MVFLRDNNPGRDKSLKKFSAGFCPDRVIVKQSIAMDSRKTPDSLSRALTDWELTPPRAPDFRARVWRRVQMASPATWGDYARKHAAAVGGVLVLAIGVGAFTGRERARSLSAEESARLATAYVQGMDARLMHAP
jgi:hypothetical protein